MTSSYHGSKISGPQQLGKAKNNIIFFFTVVWVRFGFHVNLTFALSFVFSMNYRSSVCKLKRK